MGFSEHVQFDYTEQSAKNFARKYGQKSMTQFCQLTMCWEIKNILQSPNAWNLSKRKDESLVKQNWDKSLSAFQRITRLKLLALLYIKQAIR